MTSLVTSQKANHASVTLIFTPPPLLHPLLANISQPRGTGLTRILINDRSTRERITQGLINKTDKGTPHDRQSTSVNSVTPINVGGVQRTDKCQVALERRMPLGSSSSLYFSLRHSPTLKRCPYSNHALSFQANNEQQKTQGCISDPPLR